MSKNHDLTQVQAACRAFPARFQTLHLGTVGADGLPEASYAPYVSDAGRYFVYLSELARHTANLRATARASVLFIEGEQQAAHLFARERLTLACQASECPRGSPHFEVILDLFGQRFGKFMQVIRPLEDFLLFELVPVSGSYVAGFARAYTLDGDDLGRLRHRNEQGHRAPDAQAERRLSEQLPS
ncbi:pyridoxamine 5'-phosphate oxidase family protein [Hydrogenophaga sp.]|uniref:HugZ family pyridoxamine 5'-phosphate oxidase n=1 Tax=Hydrogenophaga sp. TaxID=1904254 RepID=UPI00198D4282|nr:pyridoxamine 5'-phosphate oxidase family protein [Hydrogenophaga sp.]MBD3892690.1 pyridoxamine 5'-phosphate oxidase [Hydrogenophaga sp.]